MYMNNVYKKNIERVKKAVEVFYDNVIRISITEKKSKFPI